MACRFTGGDSCGHKVCEDGYEPTKQELENIENINKGGYMILTITMVCNLRGARYYIEQDGERLHILNAESLSWHMKHKLKMNKDQQTQVYTRINAHGKATIELVNTKAARAS
jgi:hypothetical protein